MFNYFIRLIFYVFLTALFLPELLWAHPVSFKDGYGIMPTYTKDRQDLELNYSFAVDKALAINTININYKDNDALFILPQFNYKLYRKNELESQTNLYLSLGLGNVNYQSENRLSSLTAIQADYETRRVYTLLKTEALQSEGGLDLYNVRYRVGLAPYLADFKDFHTWIILQLEYTPELDHSFTVTPLFRFFYNNYLVEIGSSTRGELFLAGIFHF